MSATVTFGASHGFKVGDVVSLTVSPPRRSLWWKLWHIRYYDGIDWDAPSDQCFVVTDVGASTVEIDQCAS